jgi:hypothetical protein
MRSLDYVETLRKHLEEPLTGIGLCGRRRVVLKTVSFFKCRHYTSLASDRRHAQEEEKEVQAFQNNYGRGQTQWICCRSAGSCLQKPRGKKVSGGRYSRRSYRKKGAGTIMASETVVTDHDTRFEKEVAAGDAIQCNDELRVITMRLSNGSLNLSSTFSKSLKTPTKCPNLSRKLS